TSTSSFTVGAPLNMEFEGHRFQREIILRLPSTDETKEVTITAAPKEQSSTIFHAQYTSTLTSGLYQAFMTPMEGPIEKRDFVFNVEPEEGDLKLISKRDLGQQLRGFKFHLQDASALEWFNPDSDRQELTEIICFLILGFLLLEQFLAYKWSYHPATKKPSRS
ncbi:MAG: hypothetical protein QF886_26620, partial [Planctomycetota bacterium]|nr:hypothetical protein [Planctomycetota bacterium]